MRDFEHVCAMPGTLDEALMAETLHDAIVKRW